MTSTQRDRPSRKKLLEEYHCARCAAPLGDHIGERRRCPAKRLASSHRPKGDGCYLRCTTSNKDRVSLSMRTGELRLVYAVMEKLASSPGDDLSEVWSLLANNAAHFTYAMNVLALAVKRADRIVAEEKAAAEGVAAE